MWPKCSWLRHHHDNLAAEPICHIPTDRDYLHASTLSSQQYARLRGKWIFGLQTSEDLVSSNPGYTSSLICFPFSAQPPWYLVSLQRCSDPFLCGVITISQVSVDFIHPAIDPSHRAPQWFSQKSYPGCLTLYVAGAKTDPQEVGKTGDFVESGVVLNPSVRLPELLVCRSVYMLGGGK